MRKDRKRGYRKGSINFQNYLAGGDDAAGKWVLSLPDTGSIRAAFRPEQIEDMLLALTFEGEASY